MRKLILGIIVSLLSVTGFGFADTYRSGPVHTQLIFKFHHSGIAYTYGRFNEMVAVVEYNADDIASSSIQLEVATDSIDVGVGVADMLDEELAGPDFFNAAQFPSMTFVSSSVAENDDGTLAVTGDLTLLGVSKEMTVTVEKTGEGESFEGDKLIGFHSEFEIDRTDFGMDNLLPASGGSIIHIIFTFEGTLTE